MSLPTPANSYTELGFQIKHFKFAVRIPKLRRPKLMRKKRTEIEEPVPHDKIDWASEIHKRYRDELRRYGRTSTTTSSGGTASTADSHDWIRDFHSRYNPVVEPVVSSAPDATILSDNPESTSTPLSLSIHPMNRMVKEAAKVHLDFLDLSGVKIYDNIEESDVFLDSHGSSEHDSSDLSDQSYEIVSVVDHKVIAVASFKPRTLKYSSGTLQSRRSQLI